MQRGCWLRWRQPFFPTNCCGRDTLKTVHNPSNRLCTLTGVLKGCKLGRRNPQSVLDRWSEEVTGTRGHSSEAKTI